MPISSTAQAIAPPAASSLRALYEEEVLAEAAAILARQHSAEPRARTMHVCGILALKRGARTRALQCLRQAVTLDPDNANYLGDLGTALSESGLAAEAIAAFCRALQLSPGDVELYQLFGDALARLRRGHEALAIYAECLRLAPSRPRVHMAMGDLFMALSRDHDALLSYTKAVDDDPLDATALLRIGQVYLKLREWRLALEAFTSGLRLQPDKADLHLGAGNAHWHLQNFDAAAVEYLSAVREEPHNIEARRRLVCVIELLSDGELRVGAWCGLGAALRRRGQFAEAAKAYERALSLKPRSLNALVQLGQLHMELARPKEAISKFEGALRLSPTHASAQVGLASALLLTGDASGWKHFAGYRNNLYERDYEQPRWDGEPLENGTLFVWADQGLGDAVQYARYFPLLKTRVGRVIFQCQRELMSLMARVPGVDIVVGVRDPLSDFDRHAPLFSIARLFCEAGTPVPAAAPYLTVDPEKVEYWRQGSSGRRRPAVGIVWRSRADYYRAKFKSIPLRSFGPLLSLPGIRFVSLQLEDSREELDESLPDVTIDCPLDTSCTAADTAALILTLDLVVSVDTMVCHLAGALGKPVWTLVPFNPDWRWRLEGERCDWYPTMRLFRQTRLGDWDDVLRRLATTLADDWRLAGS